MKSKLKYILVALVVSAASCNKAFLDKKPLSTLRVPATLHDFRQLLDNGDVMYASSELPEVLADNYYLEPGIWQAMTNVVIRNTHVWAADIFESVETHAAWNTPYQQIFYANVVLDGLKKLDPQEKAGEWNNIKGSALFLRAHALFSLVQLFSPAYDEQTAGTDAGVPVPLSADVNEEVKRKSVQETYDQVLGDLLEAETLLIRPRDYRRPSKLAARALLARVFLNMRRYEQAGDYADRCLQEYHVLVDFNTLTAASYGVLDEVIYCNYMNPTVLITFSPVNVLIAPDLYASYADSDRRKAIYFRLNSAGKPHKGSTHSFGLQFTGLATDEILLIRAEAAARAGRTSAAMDDLNRLLQARYTTGTFTPLSASGAEEALELVLTERRKELVFRNLRWPDLKRLNAGGESINLTRTLGEDPVVLPAGTPRWVFPIPPNEVRLNGLPQNER